MEITSWKECAYDCYSRVEKYWKMNQLAQRMSEFPDTLQPVNKNGTKHFSCCYLFIREVPSFMCESLPKKVKC